MDCLGLWAECVQIGNEKMAIDFTPLMSLLISIIPILLLVSVLGYFLGKRKGIFALIFVLGLMFAAPVSVMAAGTMTPSAGTLATDLPSYFSIAGATASSAYHVNVSVAGATPSAATVTGTTDSNGAASWSLTFLTEGATVVSFGEGAFGSGTNVVTGSFNVVNMINLIMPYIILAVTLSIVFGVAGLIGGVAKFGKN